MDLGATIMHMLPDADPIEDFTISQAPGAQPEITQWNEAKLGARPTAQQLTDAWIPALKEQKEAELILAADAEEKAIWTAEIEFKYVLVKRMMGQTISASQQQKAQAVLAIFVKLEEKIGQVRQATTEAGVEAVKWS